MVPWKPSSLPGSPSSCTSGTQTSYPHTSSRSESFFSPKMPAPVGSSPADSASMASMSHPESLPSLAILIRSSLSRRHMCPEKRASVNCCASLSMKNRRWEMRSTTGHFGVASMMGWLSGRTTPSFSSCRTIATPNPRSMSVAICSSVFLSFESLTQRLSPWRNASATSPCAPGRRVVTCTRGLSYTNRGIISEMYS